MSNFESVLQKYRAQAESTVELGNSFERLIKNFLATSPTYQFSDVWLWSDFPYRATIDLGIDIVALDQLGDFWAVQCKFYQPDVTITLDHISHFVTASEQFFFVDGNKKFFSQRLWIDTTIKSWSPNVGKIVEKLSPPLMRLGLFDLEDADVDWLALESSSDDARIKNTIRPYQQDAVDCAVDYYKDHVRGKMIMACGTGKTFTSLKIAERLVAPRGTVLYLTPSISLINQTLVGWTAQSSVPINAVCVCSDNKVSKLDDTPQNDDPIFPVTVEPHKIARRIIDGAFNVIFSTYQSLDKVADAQKIFCQPFDLIVCDEAHRTAGFKSGALDDDPLFQKVHDDNFIRAKKRLYMTATPKQYSTEVKAKARAEDLILWSMDDEDVFGEKIFELSFNQAREMKILSDYRVLVFTVRPESVADKVDNPDDIDEYAKIVGSINALNKHVDADSEYILHNDPNPMHSAVAYCSSIKMSKTVAGLFERIPDSNVKAAHVDGTMKADKRKEKLAELKKAEEGVCKVLTNARCLSEGIDVPSLDAIIFLSPRKSKVDIIQAVGRVMRKAHEKNCGYVIIPIVVPAGVDPAVVLDNNKDYKVIWDVLNALRSHDEDLAIEINKLKSNHYELDEHSHIIITSAPDDVHSLDERRAYYQTALDFPFRKELLARIVEKVGTNQYWATWGRDVAAIAERHKARIEQLIAVEGNHKAAFDQFLAALRQNINPAVAVDDAVDMLAQHLITRPVFEALFENYNFMDRNAVSRSMQNILTLLDDESTRKDAEQLNKIYASVQKRCAGIKSPKDRQDIIIDLYDKFFKVALHKTVEKLGIVYTPVEVVDFILKSVDAVLRAEFHRSLSDEGVHILDPFTGTGTFITRLLELGLIDERNLNRKYSSELHANEIVLLAYYIAAINIENAFHARAGEQTYRPFDGICLTDSFQTAELDYDRQENLGDDYALKENNARINEQRNAPIEVIVGNPPYSVGQRSANDNAQNQKYPALEQRIADTYVKHTNATNKNSLYDSYIKAFRWASDRIKGGGVIGFVTNGGWLDTAAMDGLRRCFADEFTSIYVFNLRGNARTQGELRRRESGNVFGEGTRTPVTITILVKNTAVERQALIRYVDIGDYLDRQAKLDKIAALEHCRSEKFMAASTVIVPNDKHDWINQRGDVFDGFLSIEPAKKFDASARSFFFDINSNGVTTARDVWCFNYSRAALEKNMSRTIDFYNQSVGAEPLYDSTKINWSDGLKISLNRKEEIIFDADQIVESTYRPFCRQYLYFDRQMIDRIRKMPKLFPTGREKNLMICVPGIGNIKNFSVLMIDGIVESQMLFTVQCFPLHWYSASVQADLFEGVQYTVHDGITDHIHLQARRLYGADVSKDDIFYYVYGFLHLPSYRERFANDLRKSLPKLFLVDRATDFWSLSEAGRRLAELHLNYETQPPPPDVVVEGEESGDYRVRKMRLSKDKRTLAYNGSITIKNIPARSHEYVVNGRSPLEWIIDRYQIKTDKASGLTNDPNRWCAEHGDEKYILRLILSVLTVSVRTVEIVESLPSIEFDG